MELHQILKSYMEKNNLRIADVARMCDLPDSTVRGILIRKQKSTALDVAFRLSEGLGVSLEYLNFGMEPLNNVDAEKKAPPIPAEAKAGELIESIEELELFRRALYNLGILREGQNLTPSQGRILAHLLQVMQETLRESGADNASDDIRIIG